MSATTDRERYCRACGEAVDPDAEVCPACGVATDAVDVGDDPVHCRDCGEEIRAAAEICPHCGVRQRPRPRPGALVDGETVTDDLERFVRENRGLVAAVASFLFPGLGQLLNGEVAKAIVVFAAFVLATFSVVVGVGLIATPLVYVYAIYDAYRTGRTLERRGPAGDGEGRAGTG